MWAAFTCKNEVFFYKKGYIRTSAEFYSLKNPNNYVHLTNNCLQKYGEKYGEFEEGNTLSLEVLENYIKQKFPDQEINLERGFINRIKDLMVDTYQSVKNKINPNKRKNCFELFGYDFLIDEDLRTWLIEVDN